MARIIQGQHEIGQGPTYDDQVNANLLAWVVEIQIDTNARVVSIQKALEAKGIKIDQDVYKAALADELDKLAQLPLHVAKLIAQRLSPG